MKKYYLPALFTLLFAGCNNLEDAELSDRKSFIRFYEGANSFIASQAKQTSDGGYIVAGTIRVDGDNPVSKIVVIRTNASGQKIWESEVEGGSASSLLVAGNEYIVVGDSIAFNPNSDELADLVNTSARIIRFSDPNGDVVSDYSFDRTLTLQIDDESRDVHIDYHATAVTDANGNLLTLGTFKRPGSPEKAVITAFNPASMDTLWTKDYDYINRDYVNTKSLFYDNGKILWGASITESINAFSRSYVAIPVLQENSSFTNSNYYGQNGDQLFLTINDLKPSLFGYAATGTYSSADGSKGNLFFIQIDADGNFIESSIRYFDFGTPGFKTTDPTISNIQDSGEALAKTLDGGFILAGTATNQIYGGRDIWLIKVDVTGNLQWSKTLGGRSSETVKSIEVAADGGFIICGTLTDGSSEIGGLSSIFLIKTDSNGELKD
jgi:hypothetical protein